MKTCVLALASGILLSGCVQGRCSLLASFFGCPDPNSQRSTEDLSISFPAFYEHPPVKLGVEGGSFELDGRVLRALQIAADDFLPPGSHNPPCWETQAAHTFRVLRQGDIVFIRLDEDPSRCGREVAALHSGAQYAIHLDGRILRRVLDGQPGAERPSRAAGTPSQATPAAPGELPPHENQPPPPFLSPTSPDASSSTPRVPPEEQRP